VLLVHGFYCNRGFWNTWMPRLREAGIPFVAVTLGPPQAGIGQQALGIEQAVRCLTELTGQAPLLVGHSMGGLVIRSWLASQPEATALRHEAITIGSPHHGTALARLARSPAAIEMRQGSDFLLDLMRRETDARRSRLSCYWSVCDNIVFPASTATLPGARNIALPGRPHVGLSQAPEIFDDVLQRLHR
jgi:triacylglycerol esterase/lipase EstA (alpha/beta hydrolase family)